LAKSPASPSTTPPALPEVWFFHLERQPLDAVLPTLVERTLEKGWRAVVQTAVKERVEAIDALLWTYNPDSFLAHGTKADPHSEHQPVYLTDGQENPNGAACRFLIEGADIDDITGYTRLVYLFDGNEQAALVGARAQWKAAKAKGATVTYWQQTAKGGWEKKA
jgi:DNA polymerase III subunit chi